MANTSIYKCDGCDASSTGNSNVDGKRHQELAPNTKCTGSYRRVWSAEDSFSCISEDEAVREVKRYRQAGQMARYEKIGIGENAYTHDEQFLYYVYYRYPVSA